MLLEPLDETQIEKEVRHYELNKELNSSHEQRGREFSSALNALATDQMSIQ